MNNILAFHIETTGLDPHTDEIVSIALCSCDQNFTVKNRLIIYRNDVNESLLKAAYKYNKLSVDFLNKHGIDKQEFLEEILSFIVEEFDLDHPLHLLGYNVSTFSKQFLLELLADFDVSLNISSNTLDAYPVAVTVLGDTNIQELVTLFCKEECLKEEKVMQKCITFVNIFKRVRKLWNKKVLKNN